MLARSASESRGGRLDEMQIAGLHGGSSDSVGLAGWWWGSGICILSKTPGGDDGNCTLRSTELDGNQRTRMGGGGWIACFKKDAN